MNNEKEVLSSISNLINYIGDDSDRLKATPKKVLDIFKNNIFSGYNIDIPNIFANYLEYASDHEQMILLKDIPFLSFCEHHFMPIIGKITLGYTPRQKIIGINRLHMLIAAHTKRLQIQERIISNIVGDIDKYLEPLF
ncbi:MAG: GTP cyclohydrolase I, partial [Anaplasmataceae bacterium]|nr:GTP cyclohydrolase I [Anaplasmataceae bacterium]